MNPLERTELRIANDRLERIGSRLDLLTTIAFVALLATLLTLALVATA